MRSTWYIYCNSEAASINGTKGFLCMRDGKVTVKKKGESFPKCHTTTEFAFACEFHSQREAEDFNTKHSIGIILERRDL
jgi:hypothetical protein